MLMLILPLLMFILVLFDGNDDICCDVWLIILLIGTFNADVREVVKRDFQKQLGFGPS